MTIDTTFDFRTDANGKDPDFASPTLRRYHRLLWSKPLPSGQPFELTDTERGVYLYHHTLRRSIRRFLAWMNSIERRRYSR